MRILGTEPSSAILSQQSSLEKLKSDALKVPKQGEAQNWILIQQYAGEGQQQTDGSIIILYKTSPCQNS